MNIIQGLFLCASVLFLQPKKYSVPTIQPDFSTKEYTFINPLKFEVIVIVNCGYEFEKLEVSMTSDSKEVYKILDTNGKNHYACFLETWKKKDENR